MKSKFPILYTFRRCPYAMRARMALKCANIDVEIREISLKEKPREMLEISLHKTVPLLQLPSGQIFEESLDIMLWALEQNDPCGWLELSKKTYIESLEIIDNCEIKFKIFADKYKYSSRFPEHQPEYYRSQAEIFLKSIENKLIQDCIERPYLFSNRPSLADYAIFPFVRQFAAVDLDWFEKTNFFKLKKWLNELANSDLFLSIMDKYKIWHSDSIKTYLLTGN